jgi:hypothetical protein
MVEHIIEDFYATNPTASKGSFEQLLLDSKVWQWDWGLILAYENSVHLHIVTKYRKKVFLRKYLKIVASEIFNTYPVIETKVFKSKPTPLEFYTKMGWHITKETNDMWFLEMSKEDFKYA